MQRYYFSFVRKLSIYNMSKQLDLYLRLVQLPENIQSQCVVVSSPLLVDVCHDVVVGAQHALRCPRRAGRVKHQSDVISRVDGDVYFRFS